MSRPEDFDLAGSLIVGGHRLLGERPQRGSSQRVVNPVKLARSEGALAGRRGVSPCRTRSSPWERASAATHASKDERQGQNYCEVALVAGLADEPDDASRLRSRGLERRIASARAWTPRTSWCSERLPKPRSSAGWAGVCVSR
jgi:hypothetical protein